MDSTELQERQRQEADSDTLIADYRTILAELSLLTTVSVLLFGFLLASPSFANNPLEEWIYSAATILVATATMIFVIPVAYHHLQFPYLDFAKFQARSHRWIQIGLPLLAAGFYCSLSLPLWSLFGSGALIVAGLPVAAAAMAFALRKGQL